MRLGFKILLFNALIIAASSCKSDKPNFNGGVNQPQKGAKVWISNEGNFQFGNAALGIYNPDIDQYAGQVFQSSNAQSLGDVLQSVSFIDSDAYLVVNNSGKILVVDTADYLLESTINGFTSPRYLLQVANDKAYVSDLYADAISVLDLNTNQIVTQIFCGNWTEKMIKVEDKVFVSMPQNDKVYVINTVNDAVIDSIQVDYGSNSIALDQNNKLWVLCSGSSSKNREAGLFQLDPSNLTVIQRIALDKTKLPSNLQINSTGDQLFFIQEDIYKIDINASQVPTTAFYAADGRIFYGLNINPHNDEIYVADAKDYVQKGKAYRLDSTGQVLSSFETDINPNGFYFE